MKRNELGRSMIEMLGVLAIVGVLSVGGIAGFNKAMFKYKLQKTTEEYNMLFQEVLKYHKELIALRGGKKPGEGDHYNLAQLLSDMSMVPSTWKQSGTNIFDRLNNKITPFVRKETNKLSFNISITTNDTSVFVCEAIYRDIFMQYSDYLYWVTTWRKNGEDKTSNAHMRYGNIYCNGTTNKCVKDMTLTDIRAACSVCEAEDKTCVIMMDF